jgi:hypothetical protein
MPAHSFPWLKIAAGFDKGESTCRMHLTRIQRKAAAQKWTADTDALLKESYQRKKEIWGLITKDMGIEANWKVVERRVFEIGQKGLNSIAK